MGESLAKAAAARHEVPARRADSLRGALDARPCRRLPAHARHGANLPRLVSISPSPRAVASLETPRVPDWELGPRDAMPLRGPARMGGHARRIRPAGSEAPGARAEFPRAPLVGRVSTGAGRLLPHRCPAPLRLRSAAPRPPVGL